LKVSGFTIARNVVRADYPLKEAVYSVLPLCDEFVIAVGNSNDGTLEFVQSFEDPKIRIIETQWDDNLRSGGRVLAIETDKAKAAVNANADWLFYIQADECLHERYHDRVHQAMFENLSIASVDGLLFNYHHFYGSYDYLADSRNWYRKEIRVIRNNPMIYSYRDAQGFRKGNDHKLRVKEVKATIFHYGWVKHPEKQQAKQEQFHRMWHDDDYIRNKVQTAREFDYGNIDSLTRYTGTHPEVMKKRIEKQNWTFDHDITQKNFGFKAALLHWIEKVTGWRIGEYKNYRVMR
jgi:glycosyltransferase involved in cell wall biosynthesis